MITLRTLLGKNNLDFSLTCLKTCIDNCTQETTLEVFEDGSLTDETITQIQRRRPQAVVKKKIERDSVMHGILKSYPLCNAFRNANVFGFKLFDTILYEPKPFFYLDSDIIFYRKFIFPERIQHPVFMMDAESAYCFNKKQIYVNRQQLLPKINAGFYYFPSKDYDLQLTETLIQTHYHKNIYGHSWAEQTLFAFIAAKNNAAYFNPKQVLMASPIIKPGKDIIAIHYSKPYRSKITKTGRKIQSLQLAQNPVEITLVPAKKNLRFFNYLVEKYKYKVFRNQPLSF